MLLFFGQRIATMSHLFRVSSLVSRYGVKMRQLIGAVRIRVYELLQLLSPRCYESQLWIFVRHVPFSYLFIYNFCWCSIRLLNFRHCSQPKHLDLYASLLREVVADVTLSDNVQSTTCTSLPMHLCTGAEQTLLNPFYEATDQSMVEDLVRA